MKGLMRILAVSILGFWLTTNSMAATPPVTWPATHPTHHAMYCGFDGHEEIGIGFSQALSTELDRLEAQGMTPHEAWAFIRSAARCERPPGAFDVEPLRKFVR